jgi:SAM-dependent methyltransferase
MIFGSKAAPAKSEANSGTIVRHSSGFEQFCTSLQTGETRSILDISGVSQANIMFITGFGHRISSDDMVETMQECFGNDFIEGQQSAANAQRFLDQALAFPDQSFDGVLAWDSLQYLATPVIEAAVAQLLRITRPGGYILAFFNADEKAARLPLYSYRIQDAKTVLQVPRAVPPQRSQFFANRTVERLFGNAASLKFFLTRGSSRELLVRR